MAFSLRVIESEPFAENCYLVWRSDQNAALIVDPGFDTERVIETLQRENLSVAAILNTHGHVDHIAGNAPLKAAYPQAPLLIGRGDAPMLRDPQLNLSGKWGFSIVSPPADQLLDDGERLTLHEMELEVREIPGHSPGHVVFVLYDAGTPKLVIGGDVLFAGGVGRTDFPGGSFEQLAAGIRAKLWPLPDTTPVFPGHGPPTTIGEEKRTNPFVGEN